MSFYPDWLPNFSNHQYLYCCLGLIIFFKCLDFAIQARQRKIYKTANQSVPECFKHVISPDKFEASRLYCLDNSNFDKYFGYFNLIKTVVFTPCLHIWVKIGPSQIAYNEWERVSKHDHAVL